MRSILEAARHIGSLYAAHRISADEVQSLLIEVFSVRERLVAESRFWSSLKR